MTATSATITPTQKKPDRVAIPAAKALAYFAVFAAALAGAIVTGGPLMLALLLVPDLALLTSLSSVREGRLDRRAVRAYNLAHHLPAALVSVAAGLIVPAVLPFALVWLAHIAMDRTVGYGPRAIDGSQRGY